MDQLKGCPRSSNEWWGQGRGVAEGPTGLKQPLHRGVIPSQKRTSAAEGLPEGAAHQGHRLFESMAKPAAAWPQHPQTMGFVHQQLCTVVCAQVGHALQIGAGAFHAEQAFGHHHRGPRCLFEPLQPLVEILKIVVGKALQPRSTGADAGQQRVVNQPVHQHGGVPVTQGR